MPLTPAAVRKHCLSFPGATVNRQWGNDHVFKVGGKMFAVVGIDDGKFHGLSFKAAADSFMILTQLPGIVPAPYLARHKWILIEDVNAVSPKQLEKLIRQSYELIRMKQSKKTVKKAAKKK